MMMQRISFGALLLFVNSFVAVGCLKSKDDEPPPPDPPDPVPVYEWNGSADSAFMALNNYFWHAGEGYFQKDNAGDKVFHYWWNAHAIDALVDAQMRKPDATTTAQIGALHQGMYVKNNSSYINDYYDDMEWMALACLRAHATTGDTSYRQTAELLWADIKKGWNMEMGGGIAWRKTQTAYKNTPANAPAVILAARMYKLSNNAEDLEWAKRIYTWLLNALVDNASGLVWDGINRQNDGQIDKSWIFTYNQGVFIGAGVELFLATNERGYLDAALRTANNAMADPRLSPSGVMKEEGQGDGGLFKGILVRYLTQLALTEGLNTNDRDEIVTYLETNARSLWSKATSRPQILFSHDWTRMPGSSVDMSTQLSGLFLVEAMALLKKQGLVE